MKKGLFLLLVIGFTSLGIYSCQKDQAQQVVQATDTGISVTDRADYGSCEDCAENCYDCCLKLEWTGGSTVNFGFVNPATGGSTHRVLSAANPGPIYVCAAGGWLAIFGGSGSGQGRITVCSTGEILEKNYNGLPNIQKTLTWDCDITP